MMRTFLCFDIGGSKYNVGLLRQDGTILARQKSLWHGHTQQEMLAELFCAGHAVLAQCPGQAPCAAGATIPGLADAASGMWVEASFSGIRNVPIAHLLEQEFGLPAAIENDARACALAERMFGAGKDVDDFFYVTVSNGIGGALFLNGALYTGALGNAGEIGHCTAAASAAAWRRMPPGPQFPKITWSLAARRTRPAHRPPQKKLPPARGRARRPRFAPSSWKGGFWAQRWRRP